MGEELVADEQMPGMELIEFAVGDGVDAERISLSNSCVNGLRFEILNGDLDGWAAFHIHKPETALLIATKLAEWSGRMGQPTGDDHHE